MLQRGGALIRSAVPRSIPQLGCVRGKADVPPPRDDIDWSKKGFQLETRDTQMIVATTAKGQMWGPCALQPYGPMSLEPAASILNYGQGIFEGIKAYRTSKGRIVVFRPMKNAQRMVEGARRFLMPAVPTQLFLDAIQMAVRENAEWVPPVGQGALYLRPLLFGSGADLGVKPSSRYHFVVYVSPVGKYFGSGGARLQLCSDHQRAAPAGVGHVKCVGNYAQCFSAQRDAKGDGFSDPLYLDVTGKYIDEAAASNFFCVTPDRVIHTPQLGTILPGVTRDSVVQLVRRLGKSDIRLKVGKVSTETAFNSTEGFLTGTGAGITPIEHISSVEESVDLPTPGPVTQLVTDMLADIQTEKVPDSMKWLHDPFEGPTYGLDSFVEPSF